MPLESRWPNYYRSALAAFWTMGISVWRQLKSIAAVKTFRSHSQIRQDIYMQADQTAKRVALNCFSGLHLVS